MSGAGTKIRTRDLLITNQLLYQLSYTGTVRLAGAYSKPNVWLNEPLSQSTSMPRKTSQGSRR